MNNSRLRPIYFLHWGYGKVCCLNSSHLTNICLTFLANHVIPHAIWSYPGTVLIVVAVVGLVWSPVGKGCRVSIHPSKGSLVQKICITDPSSCTSCEGINPVLFRLGLNGGKGSSFSNAPSNSAKIVSRSSYNLIKKRTSLYA